jgi:hypothetical protein
MKLDKELPDYIMYPAAFVTFLYLPSSFLNIPGHRLAEPHISCSFVSHNPWTQHSHTISNVQ